MSESNPPPNAATRAVFPGRRLGASHNAGNPDPRVHEQAMQRPAEKLYLAQHHLNPHHGETPSKDET